MPFPTLSGAENPTLPKLFAVVDVETTGLYPNSNDRVVEVAVVQLSPDGAILDEYATLINPGRDLGPTHIHNITARDILGAPRFEEVAGDVLGRLRSAVVVGHNVRFDVSFLAAECARIGCPLPEVPPLCTLRLASQLNLPLPSRRLEHCCEHFGIRVSNAHSALSDAKATGQLLMACLGCARERGLERLPCQGQLTPAEAWPLLRVSGKSLRREAATAAEAEEIPYLSRLVERMPAQVGSTDPDVTAYMALLDRALEDRRISASEATSLLTLAQEWGLSREQVIQAHRSYLESLVQAALVDSVITESEKHDLIEVTRLLGFEDAVLDKLVDRLRTAGASMSSKLSTNGAAVPSQLQRADLAGKKVCFTGELTSRLNGQPITRSMAQKLAIDAGIVVAKNVTRDLDILVVADPDTLSSKAQKARGYGTRILAEAVFWKALGINVD